MKGPETLQYFQGNWPTNKGAWFPGEKVLYREKALFDDFNDKPWFSLVLYGIRGRMPTEQEVAMCEHIGKLTSSYPDPRLWNNRVAALAGTARSTGVLALSAATAVSEATVYGRRPDILGADFLLKAGEKKDDEKELDLFVRSYLKKYRRIPGYGRPIISKDERIKPLLREAKKLDLDKGIHFALVAEVENILKKGRYRLKANISIYCAALMLDLGYTPREFYMMSLLGFTGGILPCYIDAVEKEEGVFFPLDCESIEYLGQNKREV